MRYWEDFAAGQVYELGSTTVTAEEIIEFASRWDPQPFHVDAEAAAASSFGGLCASGWHTVAMYMRLYVDNLLTHTASQGSPGVDEVRWLEPVRPGDTLFAVATVEETRPSASRANRGTILVRWEMHNQAGVTVLRMRGRNMLGRRH
ncbi:MAG: MaoC family dehydratase [Streptosporangiales bacterium]